MALKLSNNAISRLASAITSSSTSMSVVSGDGAKFPTLAAGDWSPATISKPDGTFEIIKITARSSDALTIVRAQEGTTALAFDANSLIELRLTVAAIDAIKLEAAAPAFYGFALSEDETELSLTVGRDDYNASEFLTWMMSQNISYSIVNNNLVMQL